MRPIITDRLAWSVTLVSQTDQHAVWVEDSGGSKEPRIRWGAHSLNEMEGKP